MQRLIDQHVHSWNSFDSQTDPEENVERALEVGLGGVTITDHFDTHPSEWEECVYDDEKVAGEIRSLREKYADRIFVGKGLEVCYQPQRMEFILEFLEAHQFDATLLSVHWAGGRPVHKLDEFAGMEAEEFIRVYLESVRDATAHLVKLKAEGRQPFCILGHLDFAKRYAKRFFGYEGPVNEPGLIEEILRNCLAAGVIPEVNTSTLRNEMPFPMPAPDTMACYASLGGTMMSLGSDAHSPESVGAKFDEAIAMLKSSGINRAAVFEGGVASGVDL